MIRRILSFVGVFLILGAAMALAQEPSNTPAPAVPAASAFDVNCSGFIAGARLPEDIYIVDGADNEFHEPLRQYVKGDFVFLAQRRGENIAVGTEYNLLRPGIEIFETSRYDGEHAFLRSLGIPYVDVGRLKVTQVTPQGAIAQVTLACGPAYPGDFAMPYKPREIPQYTPTREFDRFAVANGKKTGAIAAGRNNPAVLATGAIAYINLGAGDGAQAGQRFRIFHAKPVIMGGFLYHPETPRESIGEMVILSTQEKSSVGIVIKCLRDINVGDGVELE